MSILYFPNPLVRYRILILFISGSNLREIKLSCAYGLISRKNGHLAPGKEYCTLEIYTFPGGRPPGKVLNLGVEYFPGCPFFRQIAYTLPDLVFYVKSIVLYYFKLIMVFVNSYH